MVELLRYNLLKADYEPIIARSGEEAVNAVQCHEPDLALLDVMMPGLNGYEVCRILRESTKGRNLPIIMLSALSEEEARVKGLSLGADDYMAKPFSVKELLLKIQKYIDRQRALKLHHVREQEKENSLCYLVHEMKNSLNAISGFSSLALQQGLEHNYMRTINTAAVHAESLLNDTELLTRLEKDGGPLPVEAVDIVEIMNDAAAMFLDNAKRKNIELQGPKSAPVLVSANRSAARQVLVNLISNAVKYNREDGRIWNSVNVCKDRIHVTVRDEGCGIPPHELPFIFDKFYRAPGSELIKGAGLGLYIVKLLIEAMGGSITAVSEQGGGSAFTLSFPLANSSAREAA
jgi:signal transduction histidine kinase